MVTVFGQYGSALATLCYARFLLNGRIKASIE